MRCSRIRTTRPPPRADAGASDRPARTGGGGSHPYQPFLLDGHLQGHIQARLLHSGLSEPVLAAVAGNLAFAARFSCDLDRAGKVVMTNAPVLYTRNPNVMNDQVGRGKQSGLVFAHRALRLSRLACQARSITSVPKRPDTARGHRPRFCANFGTSKTANCHRRRCIQQLSPHHYTEHATSWGTPHLEETGVGDGFGQIRAGFDRVWGGFDRS